MYRAIVYGRVQVLPPHNHDVHMMWRGTRTYFLYNKLAPNYLIT